MKSKICNRKQFSDSGLIIRIFVSMQLISCCCYWRNLLLSRNFFLSLYSWLLHHRYVGQIVETLRLCYEHLGWCSFVLIVFVLVWTYAGNRWACSFLIWLCRLKIAASLREWAHFLSIIVSEWSFLFRFWYPLLCMNWYDQDWISCECE